MQRKKDSTPEAIRLMRLASIAVVIPAVMGLSPLVGWFGGSWIGGFWGYELWGAVVGIVLGFAAGLRETILLVRRIIAETK